MDESHVAAHNGCDPLLLARYPCRLQQYRSWHPVPQSQSYQLYNTLLQIKDGGWMQQLRERERERKRERKKERPTNAQSELQRLKVERDARVSSFILSHRQSATRTSDCDCPNFRQRATASIAMYATWRHLTAATGTIQSAWGHAVTWPALAKCFFFKDTSCKFVEWRWTQVPPNTSLRSFR